MGLRNSAGSQIEGGCAIVEIRTLLREERGSEAVEFALAFSVWMAAAFLIMYVAFALYAAHFVANSAEEAARFGSVRGASWGTSCGSSALDCTASSTDISNYVKTSLPPGLSSSNLTVATSWPGTTIYGGACDTADGSNGLDCTVKVTVSYQFSFPVPFLTSRKRTCSSTSQMAIVK